MPCNSDYMKQSGFDNSKWQYSDGSGWAGWEQWGKGGLTNSDLQFYFPFQPVSSPGAGSGPVRSAP